MADTPVRHNSAFAQDSDAILPYDGTGILRDWHLFLLDAHDP